MTDFDPGTPDAANLDRGVAEREQVERDIKEAAARKKAEARLVATLNACGVDRVAYMRWKGSVIRLMQRPSWEAVTTRAIDAAARNFEGLGEEQRLEKVLAQTRQGAAGGGR